MNQGTARSLFLFLAVCAMSAMANAQTFLPRDERPIRGGTVFPDGGPDGDPIGMRDRTLYRWRGAWMPYIDLPGAVQGISGMAFDRAQDHAVCIMMVGLTFVTYTLDDQGWQAINTPTPAGVELHYDPALGAVLLFTATLGGTQDYRWSGTAWIPLPANVRPVSVRDGIAADFARLRLVALTPPGAGSQAGATYEWNGSTWTLITTTGPAPRDYTGMRFDPMTNTVLLFGGRLGGTTLTDTWQWNGVAWTQLATTPNPLPLYAGYLGFDRLRHTVVLLPGDSASTADHEWTGSSWSAIGNSHPATTYAQIANDHVSNRLVMYTADTTYKWDGITWVSSPTPGPSRRFSPMAWDLVTSKMVVFGGVAPPFLSLPIQMFPTLGDTWTYDGIAWTQLNPAVSPPPRRGHALVPHAGSGGVVLFGGLSPTGVPLQDTWLWSLGTWTQVSGLVVSPPPGISAGAAGTIGTDPYVLAGNQLWQWNGTWNLVSGSLPTTSTSYVLGVTASGNPLLTSRSNEVNPSYEWISGTWVTKAPVFAYFDAFAFDPLRSEAIGFESGQRYVYTATPAAVTTFGTACGSPAPGIFAESMPVLGTPSLRIDVDRVQGIVGVVADVAPGNSPIGGGCSAYVANPIAIGAVVANASGTAAVPLPIPAQPTLLGVAVHAQAVSPQAGLPLGLAVSARLTLQLGN